MLNSGKDLPAGWEVLGSVTSTDTVWRRPVSFMLSFEKILFSFTTILPKSLTPNRRRIWRVNPISSQSTYATIVLETPEREREQYPPPEVNLCANRFQAPMKP